MQEEMLLISNGVSENNKIKFYNYERANNKGFE